MASETIEKTESTPVCAVGRASAMRSAPSKECEPPSLVLSLFALIGLPVGLAQDGAVAALGGTGLYLLVVCWGAALASMISHVTGIGFCVLAVVWFGLSCAGGAALYYWPA